MEIVIERRVEIALRSLEINEQKEISAALKSISSVTPNELSQILNWYSDHCIKLIFGNSSGIAPIAPVRKSCKSWRATRSLSF